MLDLREWLDHFRHRFGGFAVLSGVGWLIDFATYTSIAQLHVRLFGANLAGAAAGMATVFIGARLSVFRDSRSRLPVATGLYIAWSVVAILFASVLIDGVGTVLRGGVVRPLLVAVLGVLPVHMPVNLAISTTAKIVVTPLTILLNFCAMTLINGHRTHPTPVPAGEDQGPDLRPDVQLRKAGWPGRQPM
jgi:putative flippase GtrA